MNVKKMYINNQWQLSHSGETREIINPATEEVIAVITEGAISDTKNAIEAAHEAFYTKGWGETHARERAALLFKLADKLERDIESFALLETLNNGKPLRESSYDIEDAVNQFRYYAGLATKPAGQVYDVPDNIQAFVVKEPVGVAGLIVPWNYPLVMAVQKLAPALAAGCTVVIKPAEQTPLSLIKLFELVNEVGFPPGVVNLVLGAGETVGAELARNPLVDKIAFTGGTVTGKKIMKSAADTLKNISLELGGKSPNIVFEDADFETAVDYALYAIFANQGQVCSAGSRLLIQQSLYEKFILELVRRANAIQVGEGTDPKTEMGPLISKQHMEKVLEYIEQGKEEGAEIVCGGNQLFNKGYFVAPTIFTNTHADMTIVKEEIFGPVLVVQTFVNEEEAIKLANDSDYGLAGAVFTSDGAKALRVIRKLRAGITWVNTYHPTFNEAPWGGYKQSGIGRELGTFGLEAFQEVKQVNISLEVQPSGWFKNK
ncbi:betaine-aldehyde dehydrogenase [Lysinibacillus contaminans]|uniref:Betaine-aldehyde dehydrogenase n=1 Tax=Lysinibacillus contaminans TaxID=1293441 RepID=A0ABR5K1E2_9BACI|nr:aldehyde dehydrogenase family protein [Lysinibacillus contaminans]KOS68666.1 betaine-aldehyde dehydrogenase [Lysinibacillus contaminans]